MKKIFPLLILILLTASCGEKKEKKQLSDLEIKMNGVAEKYVKLVLEVGKYDPLYVDAYYGPKQWKPAEENLQFDSTAYSKLIVVADSLLTELELLSEYSATELETLRYRYLYKQLFAVKTKILMLNGTVLPFDLESRALYDATPVSKTEEEYQNVLDELDKIVPGKGNLSERITEFKKKFEIPKNKIPAVFDAAVKECRSRTGKYINLPAGEKFKAEYVEKKPWSAYNWYKGNLFSVIQIAIDFPVYINNPVGLASHEGYPGHHVLNSLIEQNLVKNKGWIEYSVYPLYSPQSLIAEGSAIYGEEILFPENERMKFEKQVLFTIAGLDTSEADIYYQILSLQKKLSGCDIIAARNYLDGNWTAEQTVEWLQKFQLRTKERAEKFLSFIDTYRSYVITYSVGNTIINNYIETNGGTENNLTKRWELFTKIISEPQTPSGLTD